MTVPPQVVQIPETRPADRLASVAHRPDRLSRRVARRRSPTQRKLSPAPFHSASRGRYDTGLCSGEVVRSRLKRKPRYGPDQCHGAHCALGAFTLFSFLHSMVLNAAEPVTSRPTGLRFEVRLGRSAVAEPAGSRRHQPGRARAGCSWCWGSRYARTQTRRRADRQERLTVLGRDVVNLAPDAPAVLDAHSAIFPLESPESAQTRNLRGPGSLAHQSRPQLSQRTGRPVQPRDHGADRPGPGGYGPPGTLASRARRDTAG